MYLYDGDFLINNFDIGKYVTQISYGHNKIWGSDTGRNTLSGKTTGTFKGIIWKFKLTFAPLSQQELETISPILDSAWQQTLYYDSNYKRNNTIETYTGDWETLNKNTFSNVVKANESFDISVIATTPIKY